MEETTTVSWEQEAAKWAAEAANAYKCGDKEAGDYAAAKYDDAVMMMIIKD